MAAGVVVKDKGYAALFNRLSGKLGEVTVGVHDDVGSQPHPGPIRGRDRRKPGNATIADVATWLEFGTVRNPARSFVRDWADRHDQDHRSIMGKLAAAVIRGTIPSAEEACRLLGEKLKGSMVRDMGDGLQPPNAPSTIERKGSSTPGIDSGTVRKAIDFKVT